jgi:hypothetical protein
LEVFFKGFLLGFFEVFFKDFFINGPPLNINFANEL